MSARTLLGPISAGFHLLLPFGRYPPFEVGGSGAGALDDRLGIPRLTLVGDATACGRQQGERLSPQIHSMFDHALRPFLGRRRTRERFVRIAHAYSREFNDDERSEMTALAEALGVDEERVLLANTFVDAHKVVLCSTIVTRDRSSGRRLIGRNLDFPCMGVAHRLGIVTTHAPTIGRRHATIGWPGLVGVFSGMNDAGVCVTVNLSYGANDAETGLPVVFHVKRVLRDASDIDDVESILRSAPHASANNITVGDATGRAAIFEVGPTHFRRRDPDATGFTCATNHFVAPARMAFSPMSLTSRLRFGSLQSNARHLARHGSVREVQRALRRVGVPMMNLQSMVFEPEIRTVHVSIGSFHAARGRFVTLGPDALGFSAQNPTA